MSENKQLNEEQLEKVTGGYGGYYSYSDCVQFRYQVGDEIKLYRKVDCRTLDATITNRGVGQAKGYKYYACYYCEVHNYAGSGWLGDIDGVKFENRLSNPIKTGV